MARKNGLAIALDVDGTLVARDGIVPPKLKQALQNRWGDALFILASGRPPGGIHYIFDQIERAGHYVALNGGVVSAGPEKEPLQVNALSQEHIKTILEVAAASGLTAAAFGYEPDSWGFWGSRKWAKFEGDVLNLPATREYRTLSEMVARPIVQLSITVDADADQTELSRMLKIELPDDLLVNEPVPRFVEIIRKDAQKNNGLQVLADQLGFETLIAVGDSDNDLGMVQHADIGYAMGHAAPILKSIADVIIPNPAFDNLADLIDRLFDQ